MGRDNGKVRSERLPRAVRALLGTGKAACRRCLGDGVVARVCLCGVVFRPCGCIAKRGRVQGSTLASGPRW
jgi:hypothetical protein